MGGECLRTTLSLYTEMWSACEKLKTSNFKLQTSQLKNEKAMKRFTLKRIVEIVITILTAIVTTLGTQSCMG